MATWVAITTQPVDPSARVKVSMISIPGAGQSSAPPRALGTNNDKSPDCRSVLTVVSVSLPCFSAAMPWSDTSGDSSRAFASSASNDREDDAPDFSAVTVAVILQNSRTSVVVAARHQELAAPARTRRSLEAWEDAAPSSNSDRKNSSKRATCSTFRGFSRCMRSRFSSGSPA